jgi:hypothetical protein
MTERPYYPPGNPLSESEAALHYNGFVPATKLDAWKAGGAETRST